jgi:hypothetical protein
MAFVDSDSTDRKNESSTTSVTDPESTDLFQLLPFVREHCA